jgi:hypothetical protein
MADAPILRRLISQLIRNGKSPADARRIAIAALQKSGNLKPGSTEPTEKGIARGKMTPAQRAIDRAKKKSKGEYKYNPYNNTAVKGKINTRVKRRA